MLLNLSSGAATMASRRAIAVHRLVPVAVIAAAAVGLCLAFGYGAPQGATPTSCAAPPCVAEAVERIEAPRPAERSRTPSTPTLDWRSLLPAGFLRPR
jgi:hypothetical protein